MSAVLNDRDAILQAATVRIVNPKNAWINLTASAPGFHLNAAGQVDLAKVTVTADLVGLDDAVSFTAVGGTLSNAVGRSVDVTYDGQTAIVTATVMSNGDEFKRSLVIPVLRDGASGTGTPGARGAGHYYGSGTAWTDTLANITVPTTKVVGDVVTISSGTFVMEKRWTGSAWVENGVVVNGRLIATESILTAALAAGAITTEKLAAGAVTARSLAVMGDVNNLIPDPRFKDLAWWGLAGQEVSPADWTDQQLVTDWKQNASLYMWPNGYVAEDAWTGLMPIVPGATYLIEYRIGFSNDWYGELSVEWHWPLVAFYQNGVPSSGYNWPDGGPIQYASNARGVYTVVHVVTIPNDPRLVNSQVRIRRRIQSGSVEIGGFSITRVMDSVLIKDGAITAQKISVQQIAAMAAYLGNVELGPLGALRQRAAAFGDEGIFFGAKANGDPALSMVKGDRKILFDLSSPNPLQIINPDIQQAQLGMSGVPSSINGGSSLPNDTAWRVYGSFTVTPTNMQGTATVTAFINVTEGEMRISQSGNTITVSGRGTGGANGTAGRSNSSTIFIFVTDSNNRNATARVSAFGSHGVIQ